MKNFTFKTLFLLGIVSILFACKDKDKDEPKKTYDIYIDFWNPTGSDPQIKLNAEKTSKEIKIDFTKTFEGKVVGGNETEVIIDNFRLIDNNYKNYAISKITAYEWRETKWKQDVEFIMSYERTRSLSLVLVLDRSKSLGEDFTKVKEYAIDFVNKVFETATSARIGIVDFADDINQLDITSDKDKIISYIQSLKQGKYTKFYEALDKAITMIDNEKNAESKAILGFTDGTDNGEGVKSEDIYNRLTQDESKIKISSFMIGLEGKGGVDKDILRRISTNGGVAQFPNGASELERTFKNFSSAIANVYNLTYTRNKNKIAENSPARLKFAIETVD